MAVISIEARDTKKKTQAGNAAWSKWKPASAALAALSIGCSDSLGTYDSSCTASGTSCTCNVDGGVVSGMFDDAGSCLPVTPPTTPPPTCGADPSPNCFPQSVTKTLNLDGGSSSSLTIGDYNIILMSTYQDGNTYGATIFLNDFCGNSLYTSLLTIGAPLTYTQNFGNIAISVTLNQVAAMDPQWAELTATMSCPFYVNGSPPVCKSAVPASNGGNMYLGSEVNIGGYGFTYTGDTDGYANILVKCNGATLDSLQCIVGQQTVVARPMDNGGRTISVAASNAFLQYADVQINVQ
jgi:hypothetical protein